MLVKSLYVLYKTLRSLQDEVWVTLANSEKGKKLTIKLHIFLLGPFLTENETNFDGKNRSE